MTALTSHGEGVPNVLLESIACGRSFVATDVGGVREIADESIDRVVGPADAEAFADAVLEVVQRETADSEPQGVEALRFVKRHGCYDSHRARVTADIETASGRPSAATNTGCSVTRIFWTRAKAVSSARDCELENP